VTAPYMVIPWKLLSMLQLVTDRPSTVAVVGTRNPVPEKFPDRLQSWSTMSCTVPPELNAMPFPSLPTEATLSKVKKLPANMLTPFPLLGPPVPPVMRRSRTTVRFAAESPPVVKRTTMVLGAAETMIVSEAGLLPLPAPTSSSCLETRTFSV